MMASTQKALHLFQAVGIELEYMIVDLLTLDVKPITDRLIYAIVGQYLNEINCGKISYSNELALHVIELKTSEPEKSLIGLETEFQKHVGRINALLAPFQAKLLPTAAHPWMNPHKEMKLWTHEHNPIYETYDRIFDCRGHGWSNLQSSHINLPFSGDQEFSLLHSSIRLLLPIMPALAASSPILEGAFSGKMDKRLDVYRYNQKRIPNITGQVIPEACHSQKQYEKEILQPIYDAVAEYDPQGILQFEWLNSRGAIARFERMAIEIRVLDIQECPTADIAIAYAIEYVLQQLINNHWSSLKKAADFPQKILVEQFFKCVDEAENAMIDNLEYLAVFGLTKPLTAGELWRYLLTDILITSDKKLEPLCDALEVILREGSLSSRIMRAYRHDPTPEKLKSIYTKLSDCLAQGKMFCPT